MISMNGSEACHKTNSLNKNASFYRVINTDIMLLILQCSQINRQWTRNFHVGCTSLVYYSRTSTRHIFVTIDNVRNMAFPFFTHNHFRNRIRAKTRRHEISFKKLFYMRGSD